MRIFRTTLLRMAAAAAMMLLAAACEGVGPEQDLIDNPPTPDEEQTQPTLSVRIDNLDFGEEDDFFKISVTSNKEWWVETDSEWIHGDKNGESSLIVSADPNAAPSTRAGSLTIFASEELSHTITVRQLGWGKDILLNIESASLEADGGEVAIEVTTNFDVKATPSEDWITESPDTRAHPVQTKTRVFIVKGNFNDKARKATITFSDAADGESDFEPKTFTVSQKGLNDYAPGNAGSGDLEIKDPVKVKVTGAEAELKGTDGHGIEATYDGDAGTYYMSIDAPNKFPYSLTYRFGGEQIDYIRYTVAASGTTAGNLQEVAISAQTADGNWTEVTTHDFGGKSGTIEMPVLLSNVTAIRISVLSANNWKISVGEMEFFKQNPDNFDYRTLFTDRSCSELLGGVTDDDIAACEHLLFRNLARWMKAGTYNTEFRVADYRAYEHPDVQRNLYRTRFYSLLDNVTGMVVEAGEEITVLAELNGRTDVKLRVIDFDQFARERDGFEHGDTNTEYAISSGVNRLTMKNRGLVYVMYHPGDWRTAPPVRIHFASGGKVNGYYDMYNPAHKGRHKELLAMAKYRNFDVVGRYSHMIYETSQFKSVSDLDDLINIYDEIVYREQVFFGLMRNRGADEMYHNRMCFSVSYRYKNDATIMYAANYHVGVVYWSGRGSFPQAADNKVLRRECWTLCHEAGHINQIRPFMEYGGQTEVLNNIMSMYINTSIYGNPSFVHNFAGYEGGWSGVIVPGNSHHAVVNSYDYRALAPFWQLQLYMGEVLGMTPAIGDFPDDAATDPESLTDEEYERRYDGFYPRFYELARELNSTQSLTNGQSQAQFALLACKAARLNLTDFFEKWGFFKGMSGFVLDDAYADNVRRQINELGYPAPTDAMEYITDDNCHLYREKAAVQSGTAELTLSMQGQFPKYELKLGGFGNVTVFEIRENGPDGKLLYILNGDAKSFTHTAVVQNADNTEWTDDWRDNMHLYAVQYDAQRIVVGIKVRDNRR